MSLNAGKGTANPLAAILSIALMLRYSFGLEDEAGCVEAAAEKCLEEGKVTTDLGGNSRTTEVTETVRGHIVNV